MRRFGTANVTDALDFLTLQLAPGLTPGAARRACSGVAVAEVVSHPRDFGDVLPTAAVEALLSGAPRRRAEDELASASRRGLSLVTLDDPLYPPLLRETHDPPLALYVWGALVAGEGARSVAVVGARAASPAGMALARSIGAGLAEAGLTVVSGLARGIDGTAHVGALEGGGRTVAVLGCGLARVYPDEHEELAGRIAERGGAIVSELPLETPPLRAHFPQRNRIIAGWSPAVVVVEAGTRSGALVTARLALDGGRDVYAVPGHPSQETAAGTNQLIRDGAALIRCTQDILDEMGVAHTTTRQAAEADPLLRHLSSSAPATLETLQAQSGLGAPDLLQRLTELELAGRVQRLPGALYVRNRSTRA